MQRNGRSENGYEQVVGERRIERDSAFDIGFKADIPLDHNQGAGLIGGESGHRQNNFVVKLVSINAREPREQRRLPEMRQSASNLMLEDHNDGKYKVGKDVGQYPRDRFELHPSRE